MGLFFFNNNGVYFSASFVTVAGEDGGLYMISKKDMMQAMKKNKEILLHTQEAMYAIGAHSTPNMDGTVDTQGYMRPLRGVHFNAAHLSKFHALYAPPRFTIIMMTGRPADKAEDGFFEDTATTAEELEKNFTAHRTWRQLINLPATFDANFGLSDKEREAIKDALAPQIYRERTRRVHRRNHE